MNKKYFGVIIAVIVVMVIFVAYGSKNTNTSTNSPIKIGAIISETGYATLYGEYAKNGMELAKKEINDAGGINCRMVEIAYEDDKTDSKSAVSGFDRLVHVEGVQGVIGGLWDFVAQPLFPLAQSNKITYISPSNFRVQGVFEPNDQSFVMLTDFSKVIRKLTDYFKQDSVKKIAVVHFSASFGVEITRTIKAISAELGKGEIIDQPYTTIGTNDFRTSIAKLKQENVDTVFLDMVDVDTVTFLKQSSQLGFKPKFVTYIGAYDAFTDENKYLLEGITVLNWENSSREFTDAYRKMYSADPAKSADKAYDAVYVLAKAIANTDKNEGVARYIASNKFRTVNGEIEFLPTHEVSNTSVEVEVYRGGKLVPYK